MTDSIILSNVTREQLFDTFRGIVREELINLSLPKKESKYLSRKEVSKLLHISLPTLNEYTHKGILKGSRVGSRVLYLETEIEQAVREIPAQKYKRGGK
jgi:excisionase family DNA binding protein